MFLLDPEDGNLQLAAHHGLDGTGRLQVTGFRMGEGLIGWVAANGREALVEDADVDPRFPELSDPPLRPQFRAAIGLPLLFQNRILGVIVVGTVRRAVSPRTNYDCSSSSPTRAHSTSRTCASTRKWPRLAIMDGPTGLYNHRYFFEQLDLHLTEAKESRLPACRS